MSLGLVSILALGIGVIVGLLVLGGGAVLIFATENKRLGAALLVVGALITLCPFVGLAAFYLRGL